MAGAEAETHKDQRRAAEGREWFRLVISVTVTVTIHASIIVLKI